MAQQSMLTLDVLFEHSSRVLLKYAPMLARFKAEDKYLQ
ncbi:hypothetical protein PNIG_a3001 [Pseudoalteromonas nigrifaciens]|uniref:Uncharacterized protein n=1 Tax=Pseudoalteromonas nigrifaciens TaxID=28109 RepID=A0AAC9ULC4_9GAMM|nr:hypothetical protein PNIG_a3001 [Pseudoalteromonas nigrifaciens]SJN25102.1 hypothetical protein CZ797_04155 [Pseudoalteromonas sp. JB197]